MTMPEPTTPIALIEGQPCTELPSNLYIPPNAMAVVLRQFEGPLDLLLYLIRQHRLDILNIPMVTITEQYLKYIAMMQSMQLALAGEYLVMAATLCDIKSRLLLPKPPASEEEEEDPRAELVRHLQAYQQIKHAADALDALPQLTRDRWVIPPQSHGISVDLPMPTLDFRQFLTAYLSVLRHAQQRVHHTIQQEPLSVQDRMLSVIDRLKVQDHISFNTLIKPAEGRLGVVVTLLALLELTKQAMICMYQSTALAAIEVTPGDL